ncbi:uncharacterized protein LOC112904318 [Agrilus planipennis]|uniref:Uncharacterized protein LOC112904318 n=1 Tax=Agrilus planipennis TaxID=224129 RepID=A0A7F5R2Y9_AGRPL|nr:uncharacterized protein LOC112904318 [Agrilus planipennis]
MYWDVNSLYGYAQCQALPTGNFRWLSPDEIDYMEIKLKSGIFHKSDNNLSYALEVDLEYPQHLHTQDSHIQFPFCAEHITPKESNLKKLCCTLSNKTKYVIHFENLKQCLKFGLVLKKIHRVIEFRQSDWLKSFIDLNTDFRMKSNSDFEKNLFKLIINSVFGKFLERDRNKRDIKVVNNWRAASKLISLPHFKRVTIFNENLIAVELKRTCIEMNKPLFLGFTILELSKLKMYDFHHDYIQSRISPHFHPQLLYMDTDSLIYQFTRTDSNSNTSIYDIIREDAASHFDTSDYPIHNKWCIPRVNKKVPGLMKDELKSQILTEFISLRPKMYIMKVDGRERTAKVKGVSLSAKRKLTFEDFQRCLFDNEICFSEFSGIRSQNHQNFSYTINKLSLSSNDNKRFIKDNKIATLPWGHYSLKSLMI